MKATRIILAAAAAALIAAPAFATEAAKTDAGPSMTKGQVAKWTALDTDKDGFISKDEYLAPYAKEFDAKDADHDGKLSKEEFVAKKVMKHKEVAKKEATPSAPAATEAAPASTAPAAGGSEAPAQTPAGQ